MDKIETIIVPKVHDLGGFQIQRALPSVERKMVGPFVFFDHIGPAEFIRGNGVDVRPHPHIGLSTVTYLYNGSMYHKDSIGTSAPVKPGDVNLMTSGKGITHSERTALGVRENNHQLYGIQTWLALPEKQEEMAPTFESNGGKFSSFVYSVAKRRLQHVRRRNRKIDTHAMSEMVQSDRDDNRTHVDFPSRRAGPLDRMELEEFWTEEDLTLGREEFSRIAGSRTEGGAAR